MRLSESWWLSINLPNVNRSRVITSVMPICCGYLSISVNQLLLLTFGNTGRVRIVLSSVTVNSTNMIAERQSLFLNVSEISFRNTDVAHEISLFRDSLYAVHTEDFCYFFNIYFASDCLRCSRFPMRIMLQFWLLYCSVLVLLSVMLIISVPGDPIGNLGSLSLFALPCDMRVEGFLPAT